MYILTDLDEIKRKVKYSMKDQNLLTNKIYLMLKKDLQLYQFGLDQIDLE